MSEVALQIAEKKREVKGKGEKERYTHLTAEFQRIARRDKKASFSDQCKEIEENNRMGKTRDLASCDDGGTTWFFSSCGGILELRPGIQDASCVGPGKSGLHASGEGERVTAPEPWEGNLASRRVEEGLSRSFSG